MTRYSPLLAAYRYGLVSPGEPPRPGAFGIEVTDPALARMCTDGQIDPQHGPQSGPGAPAVIEVAATIALPRPGSTLVTIRPDCDAFGAMALLAWRASGLQLHTPMCERVARIGAMDRHDRGQWPGPRPLPKSEEELRDAWPGEDLSALAAAVSDRALPVLTRVWFVLRWLAFGEVPEGALAVVVSRRASQCRALNDGRISIRRVGERIAAVRSSEPDALALGYRVAPIVIATNPDFCFKNGTRGQKHTVAHWDGMGLRAFRARICELEAGWGGGEGIVGSPQFEASRLDADVVAALLSEAI